VSLCVLDVSGPARLRFSLAMSRTAQTVIASTVFVVGLTVAGWGLTISLSAQVASPTVSQENEGVSLKYDVLGWPAVRELLGDVAASPNGRILTGSFASVIGAAISWWSLFWLRELKRKPRKRPTKPLQPTGSGAGRAAARG
jgi:hypothetical protein